MRKEAIDRIAELGAFEAKADGRTIVIEGETYSVGQLLRIDPEAKRLQPTVDTLTVGSLNGLVGYLIAGMDKTDGLVYVSSPTKVEVLSPVFGHMKQRETFVRSEIVEDKHPWGQRQELESFQVWLRSRFVPTVDSEDLLKMLGNVKDGTVKVASDDGFSQELEVKAGASLTVGGRPKNPLMLQPYRTFREVEQPKSEFVVRLYSNPNGFPQVALFESDGGAWRLEAVAKIVAYLAKELPLRAVIG